MKRLISALMMVCLLLGGLSAGAEETYTLSAKEYDFDFTLKLFPEAFPENLREKARGYAEFLGALRWKGSFLKATGEDYYDLRLSVIPVSQPDGAIDFRIHGPQDPMLVHSSLFGDRIIQLSTFSLLNFCNKMAEHLGIPLQYVGLAYPYSWLFSLKLPIADWQYMMEKEENGVIAAEWVSYLWNCWWWRIYDNEPVKILVDALCKNTEAENAFRAVVNEIPDYFAKDFARERALHIRREARQTTWANDEGEVFFRKYDEGGNSGMELTMPRMKTGYLPVFSLESSEENGWRSTRLKAGLLGGENQQDLLNLKMSLIAFPTVWPADCWSLLSLDLTGTLLPNLGVSCYLEGEKSGRFRLEIRKPTVEMEPGQIMLTVEGELTPREELSEITAYAEIPQERTLDLLVSNDTEIQAYLPGLTGTMAKGLLRFLAGIPTSACQTVMDDLEELGVFSALLGQ